MQDWIGDTVAVMVDTDPKPWNAELQGYDRYGIVVRVSNKTKARVEEFKGLEEASDIRMWIPFTRLRLLVNKRFKGIS
ncbi:hypothetical protein GBA63_14440 [Rubrobacter tropicus]|uniref:Uncharacterized protein n=1 Tax=Rubrobacter tropicus TaxID=2653851 RepID=A0A6G8QB33_9ACTN|nr:hypothetical protein [Rubrobacter tropicus]QIN83695.1 hypothetical protein GBA63_14440 [Rubrobacter tropicus]